MSFPDARCKVRDEVRLRAVAVKLNSAAARPPGEKPGLEDQPIAIAAPSSQALIPC
jgi:hypothetical protein